MTGGDNVLELSGITKRFGPVQALGGVDLHARAGEVHALIGENGAGKSTLMKVLAGVHAPDGGTIRFHDEELRLRGPADARRRGIAMIYQELNLAPDLSVEENIALGAELSTLGVVRHQREAIRDALKRLGHPDLPLTQKVGLLPISLQQIVEIARALLLRAEVVILDEPTSSLTRADTEALFGVIGRLRDEGLTVLYISHFLEEVREIADRYTVLRDGKTVGSGMMNQVTQDEIVSMMIGRTLGEMFPRSPHALGKTVLDVRGVAGKTLPRDASFTLRRGEIFGIAGLVGAGRSELLRCLFGLDSAAAGTLRFADGTQVPACKMTPARALKAGLDLISENRKEEGLATSLSIRENTSLSSLGTFSTLGVMRRGRERDAVSSWRESLDIRCRDIEQPVSALSGGNQQKVAFARLLTHASRILFLDEPTRGIDVGSKAGIYRWIQKLAAEGNAIVMVSSYLPELLGVCDTLAVMHRGVLGDALPVSAWNETDIMREATTGCA